MFLSVYVRKNERNFMDNERILRIADKTINANAAEWEMESG